MYYIEKVNPDLAGFTEVAETIKPFIKPVTGIFKSIFGLFGGKKETIKTCIDFCTGEPAGQVPGSIRCPLAFPGTIDSGEFNKPKGREKQLQRGEQAECCDQDIGVLPICEGATSISGFLRTDAFTIVAVGTVFVGALGGLGLLMRRRRKR